MSTNDEHCLIGIGMLLQSINHRPQSANQSLANLSTTQRADLLLCNRIESRLFLSAFFFAKALAYSNLVCEQNSGFLGGSKRKLIVLHA